MAQLPVEDGCLAARLCAMMRKEVMELICVVEAIVALPLDYVERVVPASSLVNVTMWEMHRQWQKLKEHAVAGYTHGTARSS